MTVTPTNVCAPPSATTTPIMLSMVYSVDRNAVPCYKIADGSAACADVEHRLDAHDMHAQQKVASDSGEETTWSRNNVIVKARELHLIGFADNGVPIPILTEEQAYHSSSMTVRKSGRCLGNGGLPGIAPRMTARTSLGFSVPYVLELTLFSTAVRIEADNAVLRCGVGRRPAFDLFELVVFDLVSLREGLVVGIFCLR